MTNTDFNTPITHNSDWLFLFDGTHTNPNGNPDADNQPRIDWQPQGPIALSSDVRQKQFVRQVIQQWMSDAQHAQGYDIFVNRQAFSEVVTAQKRFEQFLKENHLARAPLEDKIAALLHRYIDIRWFGVLIPLKGKDNKNTNTKNSKKDSPSKNNAQNAKQNPEVSQIKMEDLSGQNSATESPADNPAPNDVDSPAIDIPSDSPSRSDKGDAIVRIGPIQITWATSLHPVELLSHTLTSTFASTDNKNQGTFGNDHRLRYAFMASSGVINVARAQQTLLTPLDVDLFDFSLIHGFALVPSRSKIGLASRFYLRIEYRDRFTTAGDLRERIHPVISTNEPTRLADVQMDLMPLMDWITDHAEAIEHVWYWHDPIQTPLDAASQQALHAHPLCQPLDMNHLRNTFLNPPVRSMTASK
ncbi:type I CRISPR-associated protein Cas7 [Sulfobacillus thermosulfidooxidans]|uniref:type I CRISPR-associated protein Cas7 n=1 Tax=Sulfobacillus thermosulfidooxidans TaxID=28034 RepID=UPI0006B426F3|nr:type I CRISPR-associated protein Cas7 [Sulfobacillus thermosulfidooxidans]